MKQGTPTAARGRQRGSGRRRPRFHRSVLPRTHRTLETIALVVARVAARLPAAGRGRERIVSRPSQGDRLSANSGCKTWGSGTFRFEDDARVVGPMAATPRALSGPAAAYEAVFFASSIHDRTRGSKRTAMSSCSSDRGSQQANTTFGARPNGGARCGREVYLRCPQPRVAVATECRHDGMPAGSRIHRQPWRAGTYPAKSSASRPSAASNAAAGARAPGAESAGRSSSKPDLDLVVEQKIVTP